MASNRKRRRPASRRHLVPVGAPAEPAAPSVAPIYDDDAFARRQLDLFRDLIEAVGSAEALWALDADPLPDEPFDQSVVDPGDLPFVSAVAARVDACCDALLDVQYRTIARRILARVAGRDPRALRRRPDVARCAAALVWLVMQANGEIGRGGWARARSVWRWFGVGDCSGRGRTLRRAAGLEVDARDRGRASWALPLGDPALLHSRCRASLIRHREYRLEIARERRTFSLESTDGRVAQVRVNARPAKFAAASKGIFAGESRAVVIVGFGEHAEDATYFALSIPEAHELVHMVQHALDSPLPMPAGS